MSLLSSADEQPGRREHEIVGGTTAIVVSLPRTSAVTGFATSRRARLFAIGGTLPLIALVERVLDGGARLAVEEALDRARHAADVDVEAVERDRGRAARRDLAARDVAGEVAVDVRLRRA